MDCGLQNENLRVKELAESLRVSNRFIYQMRACGFPMRGDSHYSQTATVQEAQDWIKANNFRLIKGIGVVGNLILATDEHSLQTRFRTPIK